MIVSTSSSPAVAAPTPLTRAPKRKAGAKRTRTPDEIAAAKERTQRRHALLIASQMQAAQSRETLLALPVVCAMVGLRATALYDRIRSGQFPQPIRLSAKCSRWPAGVVSDWLTAQGR